MFQAFFVNTQLNETCHILRHRVFLKGSESEIRLHSSSFQKNVSSISIALNAGTPINCKNKGSSTRLKNNLPACPFHQVRNCSLG